MLIVGRAGVLVSIMQIRVDIMVFTRPIKYGSPLLEQGYVYWNAYM